ncbi:MAG: hypothetical protein A2046_05415 [Bacteroidetes bacterium GWA2_30_7]|nr:MAG: hypothetical protein A2046_05415 [Bacteroidetes bacterium GWA2_30_7]
MNMNKLRTNNNLLIFIATGTFILINFFSKSQTNSAGGIFVLGGIHQAHEKAKFYTYKRMGELYKELKPDILLVETQQKYVTDNSFTGTPYDFNKFMIPMALTDKTPIFGIDWWDDVKGKRWEDLQQILYKDSTLTDEINLFGNMFQILDEYFINKDFKEINSIYITNLWKAKSEFKYHIMLQNPAYKFIAEYEQERNDHIVADILEIVKTNPGKKILIAIGIDHKYFIENKLQENNIKVYQVDEIEQFKKQE